MKNCLYIIVFAFLASCNSVKRSENKLYKGDYDEAIRISLKKIKKGRNNKSNQQHIQLLQDAFKKVVTQDLTRVESLEKKNKPEDFREIFSIYETLAYRQSLISSVLPLPNATFKITNYHNKILDSKNKYTEYLFSLGTDYLVNRKTILDARTAYDYFATIKHLQPSKYKNLDSLLAEAHYSGTDFVQVVIRNRTQQVIPKRLEAVILDFDTYNLNDFWTEYHSKQAQDVDYNFGVILDFREIFISPERINEKEFDRTVQIIDGWEYVLDVNGNVKKDSLGNDIKVDVLKELKATLLVSNQIKSIIITANVLFMDVKNNRTIHTFPLESEFIFENRTASYRGNRDALTEDDLLLMRNPYLEFPFNEQIIFDTSTDIKQKFARILRRKSFR